jgi:hypothetical protein
LLLARILASVVVLVLLASGCGDNSDGGPSTTTVSQSSTTEPQSQRAAEFQVTINGFWVKSETWDHAFEVDGKGDEVYFSVGAKVTDANGKPAVDVTGGNPESRSETFGDTNGYPSRVKAGSRSSDGGLRTGDRSPTDAPWNLSGEPTADRLPFLVAQVKLEESKNALMITPTIWEWDGGADAFKDWVNWFKDSLKEVGSFVQGKIKSPSAGNPKDLLFEAADVGLKLALSLKDSGILGNAGDRPIGMRQASDGSNKFEPYVVVLTYDSASWLAENNPTGKGIGILELSYKDEDKFRGNYSLFVQVKKVA